MVCTAGAASSAAASDDLSAFAQLNLGGGQPAAGFAPAQPAASYAAPAAPAAYPAAAPAQLAGPQLMINKPRKWGAPQFEPPPRPAPAAGPSAPAAAGECANPVHLQHS
jgi:hypothetical protein